MKLRVALIGVVGFVLLATAAPRTWIFDRGGTFNGDFVAFSGTTVVIVNKGGTNFSLKISDLSTNDQIYVAKLRDALQRARLGADAKLLEKQGLTELTVKLIKNFPETVDQKRGYMDAEFIGLDNSAAWFPEISLGFDVRDKNGDRFYHCSVDKNILGNNYFYDPSDMHSNELVAVVMNLKRGDGVRLIGKVVCGERSATLCVDNIQPIELPARKALKP